MILRKPENLFILNKEMYNLAGIIAGQMLLAYILRFFSRGVNERLEKLDINTMGLTYNGCGYCDVSIFL